MQLIAHVLLGCVQMHFLTGLARRYPALAQHDPRGGFIAWLTLTASK